VSLNGTANFTATAYDQFGHAFTSPPTFTWTVAGGGTIDAAGTFHAGGTVGSFTVTASVGAVHSTATVRVKDMPPFLLTPPTPTSTSARRRSRSPGIAIGAGRTGTRSLSPDSSTRLGFPCRSPAPPWRRRSTEPSLPRGCCPRRGRSAVRPARGRG